MVPTSLLCTFSFSDKLFKNDKISLTDFNMTANTKHRQNSSSRVGMEHLKRQNNFSIMR
jgi:hypothetical protein